MGIPCFLGGMSRGLLGRKSEIQARQQRREALKDADLVILAGMKKKVVDFCFPSAVSSVCLFKIISGIELSLLL